MISRVRENFGSIKPQQYINALLVGIGLAADIISLALFAGTLHTSPTDSNFYVNNSEFLAWVLVAMIYSFGLFNAWVRRRWKKKYGYENINNSVLNAFKLFALPEGSPFVVLRSDEERKLDEYKWRNFQRDYSFVYLVLFVPLFLYARAITASQTATGITGSPWVDLILIAILNIPVSYIMLIITSMFDFAMSMFVGDG